MQDLEKYKTRSPKLNFTICRQKWIPVIKVDPSDKVEHSSTVNRKQSMHANIATVDVLVCIANYATEFDYFLCVKGKLN